MSFLSTNLPTLYVRDDLIAGTLVVPSVWFVQLICFASNPESYLILTQLCFVFTLICECFSE